MEGILRVLEVGYGKGFWGWVNGGLLGGEGEVLVKGDGEEVLDCVLGFILGGEGVWRFRRMWGIYNF